MARLHSTDDHSTNNRSTDDREDLPQPAQDPDTGSSGSTDERSSENRRKGLEKDQGDAPSTGEQES